MKSVNMIILSLLLSSCMYSTVYPVEEYGLYFYDPYVNSMYNASTVPTKGLFLDDTDINITSFVVSGKQYDRNYNFTNTGWNSSINYMDNVFCTKLTSNPDSWGSSTTAYTWPADKKLVFSAYAPGVIPTITDADIESSGVNFYGYEIPDNAANHIDLLYSDRVAEKINNVYINGGIRDQYGVQLMFNHALSKIIINVKTEDFDPNNVVKITNIDIRGLNVRASFTQGLTDNVIGQGNPEWYNIGYRRYITNVVKDPNYVITENFTSANFRDIYIIPQVIRSNNTAVIEITYTIDDGSGPVVHSNTQVINKLRLVSGGNKIEEFRMGYMYVFNVTLDNSSLMTKSPINVSEIKIPRVIITVE